MNAYYFYFYRSKGTRITKVMKLFNYGLQLNWAFRDTWWLH